MWRGAADRLSRHQKQINDGANALAEEMNASIRKTAEGAASTLTG